MKHIRHRIKRPRPTERHGSVMPVAIGFALGAALSAAGIKILGAGFDFGFLAGDGGSVWEVFFSCVIFHLAVILSASSTLGFVLIPAADFLCGGALAYKSAAIISAVNAASALKIVMAVVLPALLIVPPLFIISADGVRLSGLIRSGGGNGQRAHAAGSFVIEATASLIMALLAAGYIHYLL